MEKARFTRREFLRASTMASVGILAASCAQPTSQVIEKEVPVEKIVKETVVVEKQVPVEKVVKETVVVEKQIVVEKIVTPTPIPLKFQEAPMLAEMVKAGKLPPVDERVPENPFVAVGLDGVGNYGGTWRQFKRGQADTFAYGQVVGRALLNINHEIKLHAHLAESWDVSPDAKEWTFHLRKGTKWSDGEPLTSEDFRFRFEDDLLNSELTNAYPKAYASVVNGEVIPPQFSAPDAFTVRYTFVEPKALLSLQGWVVQSDGLMRPSHYMRQFHPKYVDKAALDKMVADAKKDDWTQLYSDMANYTITPECPRHEPWILTNPWSDELVIAERNPYYWEVDVDGNQLPYFDKMQYRDFQDPQVALMWAISGELDCQIRHTGAFANYTVFKENEQKGDYTTLEFPTPWTDAVHFNMTCKDERLRNLFRERDFRIAASLCVDRQAVMDLLYNGFGTPRQHVPPPQSPFYSEKLAKAYIEYDPEKANALLDGLGLDKRDSDGYRLWNDGSGERVSFTILGGAAVIEAGTFVQLLIDYLKAIGLDPVYKGVDRSISIEMHRSNDVEVTTSQFARNLVPLADPQPWTKYTNIDDRPWCNAWTAWYIDPSHPIAEKPPDGHWIWDIWGAWEEIQRSPDEQKQLDLWHNVIMETWVREMPSPAYVGDLPRLCVTKNGFKGIKGGYWWDCCITVYEHIIDNATFYWDKPELHTT